jgi:hypothetical protein
MEDKLTHIFQKARYETSPGLGMDIWRNIARRNKKAAQIKLWSFAAVTLLSLVLLIPAANTLALDFSKSGFYEYFSLIFSGGSGAIAYWRELGFSILESLPAMSIIFVLSLVFFLFLSIRQIFKQINRGQIINSSGLSAF